MKKIAFLLNDLCMGGAERCVVSLAKELALEGHKISLVLMRGSTNFWGEMPRGVQIIDLSQHFLCRRFYLWWHALLQMAKKQDILIASNILVPTYLMYLLGVMTPCHLVAWVHGPMAEIDAHTPFRLFHRLAARFIYRRLKNVVFVSHQARNSMATWLKSSIRQGWRVIHNFIPSLSVMPIAKAPHSPLRLLFIGRLSPEKSPLMLIDMVEDLLSIGVSVTLTLIGDGKLKARVETQVLERNLTEYVLLEGSQENISPYLSVADFLILPSQYEGCPLVVLEAMQYGLPVVASNVGGITELLGALSDRLLIEQDDASLFTQALIKVLPDYKVISGALLSRSHAFSPHAIMPFWRECLGIEQAPNE